MDVSAKFVICPRDRVYWIEIHQKDGDRKRIECFGAERAAIDRLRELQNKQDAAISRMVDRELSRLNMRGWATTAEELIKAIE